jgi:hypothetical protein
MTTPRMLLVSLLLATLLGAPARATEPDPHGLARALASRLAAARPLSRDLAATDFQGTDLGCIVLPRREIRPYGYPGHAFLCEAGVSGEVLGAVLNRTGRRLCEIRGTYAGDFCYDFDICDVAETLCVR